MKRILPALAILMAAVPSFANADDADVVLSRSKKLEDMEFQSKQLAYQASMADSYKKMSDAKFLVSADGKLVGVADMEILGKELRSHANNSSQSSDMPFNMSPPGMPNGAPFTLEQPPMGSGFAVQGAPMQQPPTLPPGSIVSQPKAKADPSKADGKKTMRLSEIRANSVLLITDSGLTEVKVGQKYNGMTLKSLTANSADFIGPKETRHLKFDWTNSNRYGED
ncbi:MULTISPECIES: hypothetical protein [Pseudomonas]|uniref:Type IV pilus biogenesis protein PilP n=1 Tax=Pseudomonas fluorescens TaxID=294 RepID=A0A161ZAM4_PSEFL|nr:MULTISPECIES: hypothetical protein [Pseudomonas]KZN20767.1 hypothetical protein A1D17_04275 [Pseudomonas fluorescens]